MSQSKVTTNLIGRRVTVLNNTSTQGNVHVPQHLIERSAEVVTARPDEDGVVLYTLAFANGELWESYTWAFRLGAGS